MSTDRDFPTDSEPNDDARFYILTREDFANLAAHIFEHGRQLPEVTERDAHSLANEAYEAATSEWFYHTEADSEAED